MKVYIVIERMIFEDIVNERVLSVFSDKNQAYLSYVGVDKSRGARRANEGPELIEYEIIEKEVK